MKHVLLIGLLCAAACAPVSVQTVRPGEFSKQAIPRKITLAASDDTADTKRAVDDLSAGFAAAGFIVAGADEVNAALAPRGLTLRYLLERSDYRLIREETGVEAVVTVRQFFGTELHFIDTASGAERASGCWRTTTIRIVNDVIEQLRGRKPATGLCPIKVR